MRSRCPTDDSPGAAKLGLKPKSMAIPTTMNSTPAMAVTYLALASSHDVNQVVTAPTTTNTAMNPAVTAPPTSSARRTVARSESARPASSPRKYMRYVGNSTNPHGLTVATMPRRNDSPRFTGTAP